MSFEVRIQNLGKLDDARIRVSPLTVLAGKNNTGKTFFSKTLYSILNVVNINHVAAEFHHRAASLQKALLPLYHMETLEIPGEDNKVADSASLSLPALSPPVADLTLAIEHMHEVAKTCSTFKPDGAYSELKAAADQVRETYDSLASIIKSEKHRNALREVIDGLCEMGSMTALDFATLVLKRQCLSSILRNFHVGSVDDLRGKQGDISISVGEDFLFQINAQGEIADLEISLPALMEMRQYAKVIYLDSPAFWKIKPMLEAMGGYPVVSNMDKRLFSFPDYFYHLISFIKQKHIGENDFPKVLAHLKEVVRGSIVLDPIGGELNYQEEGRAAYPLSASSIGVANLGMLAMLIERKIISKDTVLFIDEPESNLHPDWHVEMTEALWDLAAGGVRVIIATHSVDIMKRLELYSKEQEDEAKELIAINQFKDDGGVVSVESGGMEKIRDVKLDLASRYFEMYERGFRIHPVDGSQADRGRDGSVSVN